MNKEERDEMLVNMGCGTGTGAGVIPFRHLTASQESYIFCLVSSTA